MPEHLGKLRAWCLASRPKTLPAAVAPVLLGSALAAAQGSFVLLPATICLGFALLMQVGTNFANDYIDHAKGSDTPERMGPARAVASGWISANCMRSATIIVFVAGLLLGLALIPFGGWGLLPLGLICVVAAYAYTGGPYPLAYHGLGDIFVVLFFGLVAVVGTFYVQAGWPPLGGWMLALALGLVINNLLVINNYRDYYDDRKANKMTLIARFGRQFGERQYMLSLIVAGALTLWASFLLDRPALVFALLPLSIAVRRTRLLRSADSASAYGRLLAASSLTFFSFGVVLSLILLWPSG
jgi:1,4-dihydroxy-2-naphthoate octaprenyltransferase